jgi:hypothetical protein
MGNGRDIMYVCMFADIQSERQVAIRLVVANVKNVLDHVIASMARACIDF